MARRSYLRLFTRFASVVLIGLLAAEVALADVFVLTNRTRRPVAVQVSPELRPPFEVSLASGEVRPFWSDSPLQVAFTAGDRRQSFLLAPNSAYFFGESRAGRLGFQQIGLGEAADKDKGVAPPRNLPGSETPDPPAIIGVRLLVDDDEPTNRVLWEQKLRRRLAEASRLLVKHAGVGLRVVGVDTWVSDNATTDFDATLSEFERLVDPGEARLAIGFTSQYEATRGRVHLGGTRGPLSKHILLREWSRHVTERERLELLLHELGHFLGATHSPQPDSVMRPVLGDRQSRVKSFGVRFDPVNTLIIALVGEEVRRRGVQRFADLSNPTRRRLEQVYGVLAKAMPDDSSSQRFRRRSKSRREPTLARHTRDLVQQVAAKAKASRYADTLRGDRLAEQIVWTAAAAADRLVASSAAASREKAFLLALGLLMDDSSSLEKLPATQQLARAADPKAARRERIQVVGKPTVGGRRDHAKHFFVSAHLTAATDAETADRLGITKETLDAQGDSGFSFADLAANRAGIRFAQSVLAGRPPVGRLAETYRVSLYMPSVEGLPEGLTTAELIERYGGPGDERYERLLAEIDRRIDALPVYLVLPLP